MILAPEYTIAAKAALFGVGYVDFAVTIRFRSIDSIYDALNVRAKLRPSLLADYYDRNLTVRQILLIANVFIGGQQQVESSLFRCVPRIAILERIPCLLGCRADRVAYEVRTDWHRRCLIENNKHLRRVGGFSVKATGGEFYNRFHLLTVEAVEPFHNVVNIGASLQIFKDGGNRHARAFQGPGAAYLARDAFDGGTLRPVKGWHSSNLLYHRSFFVKQMSWCC